MLPRLTSTNTEPCDWQILWRNELIRKSSLFVFSFIFFFLLGERWAYAQETPADIEANSHSNENNKILDLKQAEGLEIRSIHFSGNTRTRDEMVIDNITLEEHTAFSLVKYEETLQLLKNLQVFVDVRGEALAVEDTRSVDVFIYLEEKWTLIPYLLAGSGGGSSYAAFGLYDTNFLGRLHTFNFTYGCKDEICSTAVFYRDPRVWSSRANAVISAGWIGNTYLFYNSNREVVGAFSNRQSMLTSYFDYEVMNSVFAGFGFVYLSSRTGNDGLKEGDINANRDHNFQRPLSGTTVALEGRFGLGTINYDGILVHGAKFTSVLDSTLGLYARSEMNYTSINNTVLFYRRLPLLRNSYFATRLNLSITNSDLLYMQYFVGGLDKVRGFFDNEYQGKVAWYGNAELRIPSYIGTHVALQHVFFSDAGFAVPKWDDLWSNNTAVSVGAGVRLLFLKVSRIAIRADYAYTLNPFHTSGWSFGLMQFF